MLWCPLIWLSFSRAKCKLAPLRQDPLRKDSVMLILSFKNAFRACSLSWQLQICQMRSLECAFDFGKWPKTLWRGKICESRVQPGQVITFVVKTKYEYSIKPLIFQWTHKYQSLSLTKKSPKNAWDNGNITGIMGGLSGYSFKEGTTLFDEYILECM